MPASPAKVRGSAPMRGAEPGHFGQAAGDQRRPRVVAEPQPFQDPGGDSDHVLERARQLDADHVRRWGRPGRWASRRVCWVASRRCRIARGGDHRGRLLLMHLFGEARPRQRHEPRPAAAPRAATSDIELERVGLDALGGAHQQRSRAATAADVSVNTPAHDMARRRPTRPPRRPPPPPPDRRLARKRRRARQPGEEERVLVRRLMASTTSGSWAQSRTVAPLRGQQVGERGAPASRARGRRRRLTGSRSGRRARRPNAVLRPVQEPPDVAAVQPDHEAASRPPGR